MYNNSIYCWNTQCYARYAHLLDNIVAVSSYAVNMDFIWEFIVGHLENIDKPPQESQPCRFRHPIFILGNLRHFWKRNF